MEILVHISAGSSAQDDARYRAQAQGYLAFEKIASSPKKITSSASRGAWDASFTSEDARELLDFVERKAWEREREQSGCHVNSSPSELRNATGEDRMSRKRARPSSNAEVMLTPRKRQAIDTPLRQTSSQPITRALMYPGSDSFSGSTSQQRCRYTPSEQQGSNVSAADRDLSSSPSSNKKQLNEREESARARNSWQTPPSVISDSQPSLSTGRRPSSRRSFSLPASTPPIPTSQPPITTKPLSLRVTRSSHPLYGEDTPNTAPSSRRTTNPTAARKSRQEIHPAPPPTASHSPPTLTSLLTPYLLLLEKTINLQTRFKQKIARQTRALRPFERGHWSIDITSFPADLRIRFWDFLEDFIGKGKAGWGVRVFPQEDDDNDNSNVEEEDDDDDDDDEGDRDGKKKTKKRMLNVFCWGGLVGHIWLMLWVGSERKVRSSSLRRTEGAKWIDAGGEVVIVMG